MIEESFPLFTADEEVASERELLKSVEDGPYMQEVKYIIIHCSATRENRDFTVEDLLRCHRQRKFRTIGYHFYIRRSGIITQHRKLKEVGAHCRPWNRCSIGICYEGGLDADGRPADTRTPEQTEQFILLLMRMVKNLSRCPDKGTQGYAGKYPEGLSVFRCGGGIRVLGEIIKKVAITMQFLLWGEAAWRMPLRMICFSL